MTTYYGFLELLVKNQELTPVVLAGLQGIYDLQEGKNSQGHLSAFNQARQLAEVAQALLVCEQVVQAELTRRRGDGKGLQFPFFSIRVTVWGQAHGGARNSLQSASSLPGFDTCKLNSLWVCDSFSAVETMYDSDASGRTGSLHNAICLCQHYTGRAGPSSKLARFLLDEKKVAEVFACFAFYHRNGVQ